MRNLKRALSLALASVMLLGMMVVGTSAASYTDIDENDNVEAIEVLNAVNVMIGRQGNFEPDELVNRHEMAVIMAKLVLGVDTADSYVGSHPFTDVVPWADKYVAACYENDLISGTSTTTYGGSQPLTAVQAALMMLRALGYKDLNKGATDWRAPVTAMANQIHLFAGVASNPSQKLNRNQVAQLALNTLKSPMVNLKDNTISWTDGDGQIVISGGSREYIVLSSREAYAQAINDVESQGTSASAIGGWTVELGEHLYNGKLKLNNRDTDVFMRPARTWEYNGKQIGTYVKEELLRETYSTEVTGKTLYNLLTKNTIDNYKFTIAIDGVETKENSSVLSGFGYFTEGNLVNTNTRGVGATGKGVTTEVYVDSVNKEVYIAVINTYLAKATDDYNEKRDEARFNIWHLDEKGSRDEILVKDEDYNTRRSVSAEDFGDTVKDFKKGDIVLVHVADNEIQEIIHPEVIDKTVLSSFSKGNWVNNGTKYDYADTAKYDDEVLDFYDWKNMKESTYNLYLDEYGYMIGIELNSDPDQYVFLTGIDAGFTNLKASTANANIIHMDGTMETVKVDMNKSENAAGDGLLDGNLKNRSQLNTWCKYSVSNSGVYTLTEIGYGTGANNLGQFAQDVGVYDDPYMSNSGKTDHKAITEKRTSLVASLKANGDVDSWVYGNDDTKYINVELAGVVVEDDYYDDNYAPTAADYRWIIDDVDVVITGIKDVDLEMTDLARVEEGDNNVKYINPEAEIYTLYKKGIVIAAVTIGEDNGSAATWAYITSTEPRQEDYEHETNSSKAAQPGEWTWYREAIVDGKIVDLIEVGDTLKCIGSNKMEQGEWYEVKLNADGYVRKAQHLKDALDETRYLTESVDVEKNINTNNGDVALHMLFDKSGLDVDGKDLLTFKNGNLYTNSNQTKGFSVSRDVKVALGQAQLKKGYADTYANHGTNVNEWKYKDDTYEGYEGLKAVLDRLDANFVGDLNVIFHNGAASVIIINDTWGEFIDEGNSENTAKAVSLTRDGEGEWTLKVPANTSNADMNDPDMIAAWLADRGCTNIEAVGNRWSFTRYGVKYNYQIVNVERYVEADVYSDVTSTGWTSVQGNVLLNGKAELTDVKAGDTVTVTVTAKSGYTVPTSVTVDNGVGTVALTDGVGTFKMPAKDTIVTVTFKAEPPVTGVYTLKFKDATTAAHSKVKLNDTALADGAEVQAADISKLVVEPAEAVELKTDNTAKTITVQPIEGFRWTDAWGGLWIGKDSEGNVTMIPGAVASVARFSLARAASARVSDGQQNADTWVQDMMEDLQANPTAKWEVKNAAAKTIWVAQKYGSGVKLVKDAGVTKDEADAAFENIETCTIWRTADGAAADTVKLTVSFPGAYTVVANGVKVGNVVKKAETLVSGKAYDVVKNTDVVLTISQANRGYTVSVSNATKGTKADANGIIPWTVKVTDADVTAAVTATKRDEKTAYNFTFAPTVIGGYTVTVKGENDAGKAYVTGGTPDTDLVEGAASPYTLKGIFPGETVVITKGTPANVTTIKTFTVDGVKIKGNSDGTDTKYTFTMPDKDLFGLKITDSTGAISGLNDAAPTETVTVKNNEGITYTYADANDATKTITVTGKDERDLPVNTKITITNAGTTGEVITAKAGVTDSTTILGNGVYTAKDGENEITVAAATELYSAVKVTAGTGVTLADNTTGGASFAAGDTKWIPVNTELMMGTAAYAAKYTGKTAPASFETAVAKAGLLTVDADCTVIAVTPVVVGKDVKAAFGTETKSYTNKTVYAVTGTAVKVSTGKANCVVVNPTGALSYVAGITEFAVTGTPANDKLSVASKVTFEQVAANVKATAFAVDAAGTAMQAAGAAVAPPVGTISGTGLNAATKATKVISYILPGTHVHVAGAAGDTVSFTGAATADDAKGDGFATYTIGTGAVEFKSQTNTNRYETLDNALAALIALGGGEVILTKDAEIKSNVTIPTGKLLLDEGVTLTISGAAIAPTFTGTIEGFGNVVIDGVTSGIATTQIKTSGTITLTNGAKLTGADSGAKVIVEAGSTGEIAGVTGIASLTVDGTLTISGGALAPTGKTVFGEDGKVIINGSGAGLTLSGTSTVIGDIDITQGTLTLGADTKLEAGKTINVELDAATKGIIDFASKDLTGGKDSKIVVTGTGAATNILNYASHECFYIGGTKETTEGNIVAGTYTWTEGMGGSSDGFNKPA